MKSAILALAFVCVLAQAAFAQQQTQDVVYLKNGSIVRGQIIEQVPNVSLKIQTKDGSLFVYKMEEVERIAREPFGEAKTPKRIGHGRNEMNVAGSLNTASSEGETFTVFQLATSAGHFVNRRLEIGFNTSLAKAEGANASGTSSIFLSLHFPGTASFILPYTGIQAGLGYNGSENALVWGGFAGLKIFTAAGEGAVSIQPFYLRQTFKDGSISNYGFLVGVSIFY